VNFTVIWSDFAEIQLDDIYDYYTNKVGSKVANNIVTGIIIESDKLKSSPFIGQVEELLSERKIQYRYLVVNNYKLIYSVDEQRAFIKIADVFDTRQNPPKLKRNK
jgi:plasmid stabilization system protein ParE